MATDPATPVPATTVPTNFPLAAAAGGFTAVLSAFWVMIAALDVVHWDEARVAIVCGASAAGIALGTSILTHFRPGTKAQPVAISVSFIAFVNAMLLLLVGFEIVHWSDQQVAVIVTFVTLATTYAGGQFSWLRVSPVSSIPSGGQDG